MKLTADQLRAKPAGMKLDAYVKMLEAQQASAPTPETKAPATRPAHEPYETATLTIYADTHPDGTPVPGRWELYVPSPDPAVNRANFPELFAELLELRRLFGDETLTFDTIRVFVPDDITSAPVLGRPRVPATS